MTTDREHEHTLNVQLGDELKRRGLDARAELIQLGQRRRIDVEVRIGSAVIAVEAEHGQSATKQRQAIDDADARLKQKLAACAVAVCYPENTTRETLPAAQFIWTVRDGSSGPAQWSGGDIERLVSVIRLAPAQLGSPDAVAQVLSESLDAAVRRLNESQKRELSRALDLPRKDKVRNPWDAPAKRALLVVATAVMFHSRLDSHRNDLHPELDNRTNPPQPYTGPWPPAMAPQCANAADPVGEFAKAWHLILALDYKPIFETGRAALLSCPQDPAFAHAIRDTAEAALAVSRDIASFRHDLLGRIFHTVLDTARYDGSFYTTTPAATLLATLAINNGMCDWSDPAAIARLRITDPACGTGTLLMAAAERIRDLTPGGRYDTALAAALIEQVLTGYDVNLTATHMAATTLGLLSPTTRFKNMKIGRALLGVEKGKAYLGSLEFLDQQPKLLPWPQAVTQVESGEEIAAAEPADLVIMNPPFTRDSLRHDQFSAADERKIKDREKRIFGGKPVHLSGNSGAFLYLADYMRKADKGSIAAILPLVSATAYSGAELRRYLAGRYHIETIVTSHDPERIYFSENTSIGEILLICRSWPAARGPKPPTKVVNLARNPDTPAEALNVAAAIAEDAVASRNYGTMQEWPEHRVAAGNWGAVQFLAQNLAKKFILLEQNKFFRSLALEEIAHIGPAGRRTMDAYRKSSMPTAEGRVALWHHDTAVTRSMAAQADTHIEVIPAKANLAESYWGQRGTFLLPQRMRLNTVRTFAVRLDMPMLGGAWTPCQVNLPQFAPESLEKALCVYLNSSIGVLAMLADRSNKTPSYPRFSLDDLRKLVIPDFTAIGETAVSQLAAAYDQYANAVLLPLPQLNDCPARQGLDAAVVAALDLDAEEVSSIRRQLAMEPSVTGRRYAGLGR